ncbi:hydrogenase/urease accessory protein HupE [Altererythrobacter atlanticus]|uniref:HupE / UreJ protein n=1 Tax=Croceibacterium atlanticum TaxID=1267766 RepID=A0A0F7KV31_9SPHN|nr:HupE/UreJ family protein [Croceibacterium atlanticum]AKH42620.1 HupE / UreJ protein [Croceibacterium atlanticum]MBB5731397.1 hydrogenase/urease accessory protein HupE [Croceibacterium atlanticum]
MFYRLPDSRPSAAWGKYAGRVLAALVLLFCAASASAHPSPFSYVDVELHDDAIHGRVTFHVIDGAHELGIEEPDRLLDPAVLGANRAQIETLLASRMAEGGLAGPVEWRGTATKAADDAVQLSFRIAREPPPSLTLGMNLFPYDPQHQTFVNIYDGGKLSQQWIFGEGSKSRTFYRGTTAGAFAVMGTFIPSGVHHILIGPDHLLFLFGLLLLGGGWRKLVAIVTAFTIGHSITLSLAALDIVNAPAYLVEPAIALSIIVVGADNLLQRKGNGRDLRPWVAGIFGLIHGFGFASVLREFGLPQEALGWSLFSFNVGVELGQLAVVLIVASLLTVIRRRSAKAGQAITLAGSIAVILAGAYWFAERVFWGG